MPFSDKARQAIVRVQNVLIDHPLGININDLIEKSGLSKISVLNTLKQIENVQFKDDLYFFSEIGMEKGVSVDERHINNIRKTDLANLESPATQNKDIELVESVGNSNGDSVEYITLDKKDLLANLHKNARLPYTLNTIQGYRIMGDKERIILFLERRPASPTLTIDIEQLDYLEKTIASIKRQLGR